MIETLDKLIPLHHFESLKSFDHQIIHFVTTRNQSLPPLVSNYFTIGLNGIVHNDIVLNNRKLLANQLGFSSSAYVFASQIHGNQVQVVKEEDRGKGAFERSSYLCDIDAMVTNLRGICLVTQAADCVPILFYDPARSAIGAAHAGWKGTVAKIPSEVVKTMKSEYGSNPADLIVGIGPSIGPCCYEVGDEVVQQVHGSFGEAEGLFLRSEKFSGSIFNLWEANLRTLVEAGVKKENIEIAGICTKCSNELFFSARAGDLGRFGAGIMIR
jgi:YfiH family protein